MGKALAGEISRVVDELGGFDSFSGYCEPFCGMMGVYKEMAPMLPSSYKQLAGDRNPYVVKLWKALVRGWNPPTCCSREKFYRLKKKGGSSLETIFLGHAAALRACYLTTYRDEGHHRIAQQAEACKVAAEKLKKVRFSEGEYLQYSDLIGHVIYCDPPYRGTKHHYFVGGTNRSKFDHDAFDEWCRRMSEKNLVLVSEFTQPPGSTRVWSKGKEGLFAY